MLSGGDIVADILKSHDIPFIFTLCGGHITPILVAAKQRGIRIVDVRDEKNAVFAADAFARITGIPGVAVVTAGPGVTNTLTAVKNAQMAQSPVILIGGAAATIIKGRGSLQDIDQVSLFRSIAKKAIAVKRNRDLVPSLEDAFRIARSGTPGPVFVECPIDLIYAEDMVRKFYGATSGSDSGKGFKSKLFRFYLERHLRRIFSCDFDNMKPDPQVVTIPGLKPEKVRKARKLLEDAHKPILIVGSQAMLCQDRVDHLVDAVERLGLPTYLAGMARGLLGRDHPLQMRHQRSRALKTADLVLLAGMPCDFRLGYGRAINAKASVVSVNRSKTDLNLNRKPDLGILADPFQLLTSLADGAPTESGQFQQWRHDLREKDDEREQAIASDSEKKSEFVNPLYFFKQLESFLTDDSVIVADGGDFVATASYILHPRKPFSWLDPGVFGTLGVGAGFAVGAKLSRPSSEVWLIYGDGAAGYSLQEVDTMVRHGLPVIAVVGNNGAWEQIARDQVDIFNDDVGTVLGRSDYHRVVEGYGGKGLLLSHEAQIPDILDEARKTANIGTPVCINVLIGKTDFRKGSISM